jgi:hypothetical protein
MFEIVVLIITALSSWFYLSSWGLSWWSGLMVVGMLALGYMSGNMLYDLWVVPAPKKNGEGDRR